MARKVIKEVRKECFHKCCGTIGVETAVGQLWAMIHKMINFNTSHFVLKQVTMMM